MSGIQLLAEVVGTALLGIATGVGIRLTRGGR
jgi:hypothetical protein